MGTSWHTNLSWIDWTIMAVSVVALRLVSLSTRKYMKSVSDFLSANRMAGRYLLTTAGQMANFGVVSFVAQFELLYSRGLSPAWWGGFGIPIGVIITLTGYVYYRFRQTRALTMAQYFEMRYGRRLRIYAGSLCWISGVLNFGIFPAVAARFFIYFCGIPDHFFIPGVHYAFPTIAPIMLIDLWLALTFVNMGGQVSVMITQCIQGMFCCFAFLAVSFTVLIKLHWSQMVMAMGQAPADQSMINPFHTSGVTDFNIYFYLISIFSQFYAYMAWQGGQAFFSSARNPHEQKMGQIIGLWRDIPKGLTITLLSLAALTVTKLPQFANTAHHVSVALAKIPNAHVQTEMQVPIAMANFLPVVIKGLLATIFVFFSFTCHDTYMHSWGSIFVQDVYMPIRNKVLSPEQHIKLLRISITSVGALAFLFSLFVPMTDKILMFQAGTGTIFAGGAGAIIVGGLYWRKGGTAAAYTALTVGLLGGTLSLLQMQFTTIHDFLYGHGLLGGFANAAHTHCPGLYNVLFSGLMNLTHSHPGLYAFLFSRALNVNNQYLYFFTMVTALCSYIIISSVTSRKREDFNLEQMLHRGKYQVAADQVAAHEEVKPSKWNQIVGITKEFSKWDKVLAIALIAWQALWFVWFVGYMIVSIFVPVGDRAFILYHYVHVILIPLVLAIPATIWFTIGGVMDIKALYKQLSTAVRDVNDNGRVIHPDEAAAAAEEVAAPTE